MGRWRAAPPGPLRPGFRILSSMSGKLATWVLGTSLLAIGAAQAAAPRPAPFFPGARSLLWVGAHPDDEVLAAPLLVTALVVGLVVSVFQAATQINEMTLSFIPKLVAMFVVLVVAGPWMLALLVDYMQRLFSSIPQMIG